MTKNILKIIGTIVAIIILTVAITVWSNNLPPQQNNEAVTIGQLVDKMDSLRDLKEECADNLGIADSAKFLKGMTGYCDSWDEEIISLRNQISELSKKDYEGLVQSR